jgi:hypothetical protein
MPQPGNPKHLAPPTNLHRSRQPQRDEPDELGCGDAPALTGSLERPVLVGVELNDDAAGLGCRPFRAPYVEVGGPSLPAVFASADLHGELSHARRNVTWALCPICSLSG